MQNLSGRTDRRQFLTQTAVAGGVMLAGTAMSYARIIGSNDRISIGHIGVGNRGRELDAMLAQLRDSKNAELIAVCDLWKQALEQAVASNQNYYGKVPRATHHPEELLAMKDVDAVIISTPEHSHSLLLKMTVEAGKDAYCEKPMGNRLEDIKAARDAVLQRNVVVQIGTQHRSEPYQRAVRDLIRTGILGEVSKYEIVWNFNGPRWRGRPEVKNIREQDTDWKA